MPRALVLSNPARTDLERIYHRVSRVNVPAADQLIDDLAKSFRSLTEHPKLSRVFRKDAHRPSRLLPHDDYLIFYFETPPLIEIARVFFGRLGCWPCARRWASRPRRTIDAEGPGLLDYAYLDL